MGEMFDQSESGPFLRSELEKNLTSIEQAYQSAPNVEDNRRAYAGILFKFGNIWQAHDVIAPLATSASSNVADLHLGARTALMLADYGRAEMLYSQLKDVAPKGSEIYTKAVEGLLMVYYQTNQYDKSLALEHPDEDGVDGIGPFLTFMKRFEGEPYQVEWGALEKTAQLPIINDFTPAGALPLMKLEINGHSVKFILDTGGDRLYIDENVAEIIGIRSVASRRVRYAYTQGKYVDEPLGVAETVNMGDVTLKNVPVIVAKWKAMVGEDHSDGVLTTQILKQFFSTVDYKQRRMIFRDRSDTGRSQLISSYDNSEVHKVPFFMIGTHLMFAKGSLNGHNGMNIFVDSGFGASMPIVILDETVDYLGLERNEIDGMKYYWSPINSHGIGSLIRGATQALGNVLVEEDSYWRHGFVFDALISHQYLRHLDSWTIDFDEMTYYLASSRK